MLVKHFDADIHYRLMDDPKITVAEFESWFPTRTDATITLGCSRQTFYDWEAHNKGIIPGLWSWKARDILVELDRAEAAAEAE